MSRELQRLCRQACPPHEAMLLAVDRALGLPERLDAQLALEDLAATLPCADPDDPGAELAACARLLRGPVQPDVSGSLSIGDALTGCPAHPLVAAAAAVAAAQRRGLRVGVVGHGRRVWLAHRSESGPDVVDPGRVRSLVDGRSLGVDLHWRCSHQVAGLVLGAAVRRGERTGDLMLAIRAAGIRAELPVDGGAAHAYRREEQRLRARLN